ncbi:MAG: WecB/TagA/CpsF family glycosyltransferase [Candidatus Riflebacteria bacterium]|nr:WecB/TagA/CpsF family glycosyltransferase [Candidatus Riflebacteria bacterium]
MQSEKDRLVNDLYGRFSWYGILRARLRGFLGKTIWLFLVPGAEFLKWTTDLLFALFFILLLVPVILIILCYLKGAGYPVISRTNRLGRFCEPFNEFSFFVPATFLGSLMRKLSLNRIPVLLNILNGDMSLVGPRAILPEELTPTEFRNRRRFDVKPGLICLWWIRSRANINFEKEHESDAEYVEKSGLLTDIGIALRAVPAVFYGEAVCEAPEKVKILGIPIDNLTMTEAVDKIISYVKSSEPARISFLNADCANISARDDEYFRALATSDFVFADGIGLKLAGKILSRQIKQNVNGTDLFPRILEKLAARNAGIFLFGGRPGVPEAVETWIKATYPGIRIDGVENGYHTPDEENEIIREIAKKKTDVLFLAKGAPFQEKWLYQHFNETKAKLGMGVGGLFDFYSGRIQRAPLWVREIGMEWLFRFYQEPGRLWKRYFIGNGVFLFRVLLEKVGLWNSFDL